MKHSNRRLISPKRVIVGVPTLNEERNIETCLRSLLDGEPAMQQVRVIVADGGSNDRTWEIVAGLRREFPNVALIDNPRRVQSAALNRIVMECAEPEHDVLVRCDAHAVYPPGYALRVADALIARGTASLVTAMDSVGRTCFQRAGAWVADSLLGSGGAAHRGGHRSGPVEHGHHAGVRLDWFRRIGGYDPSFSHNEDAEFDLRLRHAGGRIWLDADIRLDYLMRDSVAKLARQYWSYGKGRARTVLKHRITPSLRQFVPVLNLVGIVACLALGSVHPAFLFGPAAYVVLLAGTSLAAVAAQRSACGLWAGPALGTMHLAWGAGFLWQVLAQGGRAS